MSLLHQESPEEIDDAALGEELTKGTSHVAWAAAVAAVVVTAAIATYVLAGQKPPAATGEIVQVRVHPMHTVTSGLDANGDSMAQQSYDHVLVFAHVKLHNQEKVPIFLHQVAANATLQDGIHTSYAATAVDYDRVFIAYPDLPPCMARPSPSRRPSIPAKPSKATSFHRSASQNRSGTHIRTWTMYSPSNTCPTSR